MTDLGGSSSSDVPAKCNSAGPNENALKDDGQINTPPIKQVQRRL
jgi:hypothetical protein